MIMKPQKKLTSKALLSIKLENLENLGKPPSSDSSEHTAKPWQEEQHTSTGKPDTENNGTEPRN